MALAPHPPTSSWGRWPQQQSEYVMLDTGMVPYDSRPASSAPLQRSVMANEYMMGSAYHTSSSPTMPGMTAAHYQPQVSFGYAPYSSPPAPLPSPPYSHEGRSVYGADESRSPSVKDDYIKQESSVSTSNPSAKARKITQNIVLNEEDRIDFNTDVDEMMKIIQAKLDASTDQKVDSEQEQHETQTSVKQAKSTSRTPVKKHICDVCQKAFGQKTHLDIHRRTHTGEKPFQCPMPGCKSRHNQLGNLKSHIRRHRGEKPFACEQCGKRFPQRGNLKSHMDAHLGRKRFHCILDGCNKQFSALGNLKAHQNKFHQDTVERLKQKFLTVDLNDVNMSKEDRELFEHFAVLYKNSNKGIKGRGKRCKVITVQPPSPVSPNIAALPVPAHYALPHPQQHNQHQYAPVQQYPYVPAAGPFQGGVATGPLASAAVPSPHNGMGRLYTMGRYQPGGYEMYEMDHDSVTGGGSTATNSVYGEEQARAGEFAFGDRLY